MRSRRPQATLLALDRMKAPVSFNNLDLLSMRSEVPAL